MLSFVWTLEGKKLYAEEFNELSWQTLKDTYAIGDLLTPCCTSPAVPKTSINGVRFFAHMSDECISSPESLWHSEAKSSVLKVLQEMGLRPVLEYSISSDKKSAKADIFVEFSGRKLSFEIQHSYQTFREYLQRQERYRALGVENFWLLYPPCFLTVSKSIARHRIKTEFGGKVPKQPFFAHIPELPMAIYDPTELTGAVFNGPPLRVSLAEWLASVISGTFRYYDGAWRIHK